MFASIPLMLGACASVPETAVPIADEATFRSQIIGQDLVYPNGETIVLREDGTFAGSVGGHTPVGTWSWFDDRFCPEVIIGDRDFPYECQEMFLDGDELTIVRADGSISSD
ncbi:MAG: hypothetical protein AAGG47_18850, partial [Pseudomonadota bacterium]